MDNNAEAPEPCSTPYNLQPIDSTCSSSGPSTDTVAPETAPAPDSWRNEVASRLERYRTRRKVRTPRYPSLCLPFDAPESWSHTARASNLSEATESEQEGAYLTSKDSLAVDAFGIAENAGHEPYAEQSAKVIEFPRSAAIPVFHASELAEPIFNCPRIVEAPEVLPPPPALGGMLIEPATKEMRDRSQLDLTREPASIGWRVLAGMMDGAVSGAALASFTAVFLRLNPLSMLEPIVNAPVWISTLVAAFALLWMVYEYLFVVYTGSTPGRNACRLQLATFSGTPVARNVRRKRVAASYLSACSAGLGYFWCVMDENGLCWHDRITRTYLVRIQRTEPEQPRNS